MAAIACSAVLIAGNGIYGISVKAEEAEEVDEVSAKMEYGDSLVIKMQALTKTVIIGILTEK